MSIIQINAHLEPDRTPGKVRYSFTLHGSEGASRDFIIDVPESDSQEDSTTDVWVLHSQTVSLSQSFGGEQVAVFQSKEA